MNREIKFRGLRTDGKGWVYGYYGIDHLGISYIFAVEPFNESLGSLLVQYPVIPESAGQYIGLKDPKGVEVYEGDIITYGNNRTFSISFDKYGFVADFGNGNINHMVNIAIYPVIGNLHEHKHLLK